VYLRRLDDNQVWRVDITMHARPATPEEASSRWLIAVSPGGQLLYYSR
jgi:hypothetical protein